MVDANLERAGFDPECPECRDVLSYHQEACPVHYVPTDARHDPRACPTCGGRKQPDADTCRRCRAAGVA